MVSSFSTLMHGWIILDKPTGITSAHAVAKVKRLLKPAKIGHAGTLDPLASGVLPLALGEATKTVSYMMDARKAYSFTVAWGEERDSDDCTGQLTRQSGKRPQESDILSVLLEFTGDILQAPPSYSAIKVEGKRAYALARAGEAVELAARQVRIDSLELVIPSVSEESYVVEKDSSASPQNDSTFLCHCGKGTYIRSLARDLGRKLGCYGHVTALRRVKVGHFSENHAISLDVLENMMHKNPLGFLQPVESALDDIPAREISVIQAARLRQGQPIAFDYPASGIWQARCEGRLAALCEASGNAMKPVRVFNLP